MKHTMTPYDFARNTWLRMEQLRSCRERLKRFTYGRQWDDTVIDPDGNIFTEAELARRAGRRPLTNNLLRSLVKSVVGRFRHNVQSERLSAELAEIHSLNSLSELDARLLEEFLISGCAIQRVAVENRPDGHHLWVDNVAPTRFFCNRFLDPRGSDIRLVGMLHDMSAQELRMRFSHGSHRRALELDRMFAGESGLRPECSIASVNPDPDAVAWGRPSDPSLFRVVEVWTFEHVRHHGPCWYSRFYAPDGTVIDETRSPWAHRSHPFVVKFYPLTDGEVHPFIEDVIDQQMHINRLITTIDHILSNSAKGVLLFPTDALPAGVSISEATRLWNRPAAVIPVNPKARSMPKEITTSGRSEGASALLDIEFQLFQQISGVSGALQGQTPAGNVSASLYESQTNNAVVAMMDIYSTFNSFRSARDAKALGCTRKSD